MQDETVVALAMLGSFSMGWGFAYLARRLRYQHRKGQSRDLGIYIEDILQGGGRPPAHPNHARLFQIVADADTLAKQLVAGQYPSRRKMTRVGMSAHRWQNARRFLQQAGVIGAEGELLTYSYAKAREMMIARQKEIAALLSERFVMP